MPRLQTKAWLVIRRRTALFISFYKLWSFPLLYFDQIPNWRRRRRFTGVASDSPAAAINRMLHSDNASRKQALLGDAVPPALGLARTRCAPARKREAHNVAGIRLQTIALTSRSAQTTGGFDSQNKGGDLKRCFSSAWGGVT